MINKTKRKATVERCGSMVVIRMIGGPDCLWLNMYLDTDTWSMTCDSDIGFYAYHWGRGSSSSETFLPFCLRWLADGGWLLRTCIGERHVDKGWDYEKTRQALLNAYKEENTDEDDPDCDTYFIEEALSRAAQFDDVDAFAAVLQAEADSLGVDLPEEWWNCIDRDYTPRQKRFAEICRKVIVQALTSSQTEQTGGAAPEGDPVRHGRWEDASMDTVCSICGTKFNDEMYWIQGDYMYPKRCPECGAKMDAKEESHE